MAQASPYSAEEIDFLNDIAALGIVNSGGNLAIVEGGWTVCQVLNQGYSRSWVAQQVYVGSQSNGDAGIPYSTAQALVFYANADLCPGVGS